MTAPENLSGQRSEAFFSLFIITTGRDCLCLCVCPKAGFHVTQPGLELSYVASSDLELLIPLLLPPECWNYWPMAPCFVYALLGIELPAS